MAAFWIVQVCLVLTFAHNAAGRTTVAGTTAETAVTTAVGTTTVTGTTTGAAGTTAVGTTTAAGTTATVAGTTASPDVTNPPGSGVLPDSGAVTQPTATDTLPTNPPTTASLSTTQSPVADPTTVASTATTASGTTASLTTAAALDPTTASPTTSGPVFNNPTTQATPTTPPPRDAGIPPAPPTNPFNFLPFLFGGEGLSPFFYSQLFRPQTGPQTGPATSPFGGLPPWALFNENLRNLYLANQFTRQFGGGLAGNVVANRFLDLPDGYMRANIFRNFLGQNQVAGGTAGGTTWGAQRPFMSPQQQQPVVNRTPAFPPWYFMMET